MKNIVLIGMLVVVITGCNDNKKNEMAWQSKYDSLNNELKIRGEAVVMLQSVNAYMDSIDAYKKWLKIEMETGIDSQDLNNRMKNLMQFIKQTEHTIKDLEKTRSGYASMVAKLRSDFNKKNNEVIGLQKQLEAYLEENNSLIAMVSKRDEEIESKKQELNAKTEEIKTIEQKVEELLKQARNLEAESYYARAKAMELAAERTKLAPRKKKQTLTEAYNLYQKAYEKGYISASQDISRLSPAAE